LSSRFNVNEKLALQLNIDNLFDERFESVYGYRQSGRLTRVGLNFRFN
jgi:outer membrane cobalamin receptor